MKVRLRPLVMNDLDNIMAWVNDQEVVGKFAKFAAKRTREEEAQYLKELFASKTDKVFAIESEEGIYIGNIGLHDIDWKNKLARIGIILGNKKSWGKGYAQAALVDILNLTFNKYNLTKIWLICYEENKKMQHIAQKLGFKKEEVLEKYYFNKGQYHNMVKLSLQKKDWEKKS